LSIKKALIIFLRSRSNVFDVEFAAL